MKTIMPFCYILLVAIQPVQKLSAQNNKAYKDWVENKGNFNLSRKSENPSATENMYTVTQGSSYAMTITGSYGNPHRVTAFIDYTNDGDFNDANETLFSVYTDTAKQNITIPLTGVVTGVPLRMRIVADNPTLPTPTACSLHGTSTDGVG